MTDATLTRARTGDEHAFRDLVAPYRRELHVHCYRMLGSVQDAEDALQETLFAAWRGLGDFAERSSVRTWLYRIATNRCLNARRDGARRPPVPVPPFTPPEPTRWGEMTWLQPYPDTLLDELPDTGADPAARYDARESIALAFIVALQELTPGQRASLVLCDVLGFPLAEVAGLLRTTDGSVKGALQRARANLDRSAGPRIADVADVASPSDGDVARRFADALSDDDVDGLVALLSEGAWLTMPPAPHEYQGAEAIAAFLRAGAAARVGRHFRLVPTRANRQPAYACYLPDPATGVGWPAGLVVLTVDQGRIPAVTRFLDVAVFGAFGLPMTLD
ncbi:MAG TPA: RNA polymerase subunit sigma-70 [Micromonosporaceae bacterium]